MKRILVTGGAGFVGSHLCQRLLKEGNFVFCLDNFGTGRKENVVRLMSNPHFKMVEQDVTLPYHVEVDEIYNLACPASPVHFLQDPVKTMKTSVLGSINVLNLAKSLKAKILQASTSEIYGDSEVSPQPESYWGNVNPISNRSCYDEGKRCAETLFMDYHDQFGLDAKIVRIFNTYGPNMSPDDGRMVPNFIVQALKGENITVFGDGQQIKSFQFVDDLVEGLIRMMASPRDFTGPVNLGNPCKYTVDDLAKTILELTGSTSKIIYKPSLKDTSRLRQPDITRAKTCLNGWEARVQLREGLQRTIPSMMASLSSLEKQNNLAS